MICKCCDEFVSDTNFQNICLNCETQEDCTIIAKDKITKVKIPLLENRTRLFCEEWIEKHKNKYSDLIFIIKKQHECIDL